MSACEADSTDRGGTSLYLTTEPGLGEVATELVAVLEKIFDQSPLPLKVQPKREFQAEIKILQKFKDIFFLINSTTQTLKDFLSTKNM